MFKQALNEWADKTANFYHKLAVENPKYNLAFYTQSDLTNIKENTELLILGINPGSMGSYTEQVLNPYWGLNGKMDGKHLLKGNPNWSEHKKWPYWNRLYKFFSTKPEGENILDDDSRYVLSNVSFFNTRKSGDISDELLRKCLPLTLELINTIQPKRIIFLSGKKSFARIKVTLPSSVSFNYEELFHSIFIGNLNHIPCYGIPHPSAHLSNEHRILILNSLSYLFEHEQETPDRTIIEESMSEYLNKMSNMNITKKLYEYYKKQTVIPFDKVWIYHKNTVVIGEKYKYAIDIDCSINNIITVSLQKRKMNIDLSADHFKEIGLEFDNHQWKNARLSKSISISNDNSLSKLYAMIYFIIQKINY